ncbi:MAG: hypothetical protein KKA32_07795, partial [Actinobacteria bacterium]|nr:hypothetical protein [Actinomycetota bacterium]
SMWAYPSTIWASPPGPGRDRDLFVRCTSDVPGGEKHRGRPGPDACLLALSVGTLRALIRNAGMSVEEFLDLL